MSKLRRLLLTLIGVSPWAGAAPAGATLKIGSSAALSGPASALGLRFHAGAKAAFEAANAQGGIRGAKLLIDLRDDGYEPDRAEQNTRALVEDPQLLALFGYIGTPTSKTALPYVKRAALPFIGAFTGAEMLWELRNPHVFNVRASYRAEALELARAMKAAGAQRIGVLYQADLFGRAGLEAMREACARQQLQLVATATVKRNTTAVDEAVRTLVRLQPLDALYMVSTYESCAAFVQGARAAGFQGGFYTLSFAGLEPLRLALGAHWKGVTIAQVVPDVQDAKLPIVAAYIDAMKAQGDLHHDSISLEGYIAARVLIEALQRCKPPVTRAGLLEALDNLGVLDLGGYKVEYRPGTRIGSQYLSLRSG